MASSFFVSQLARHPAIAILRGFDVKTTVGLANACWDAGVQLVEVPMQGDSGVAALEAVVREASSRDRAVGAGTVYTVSDASRARDAGAAFLVAPGLDESTVSYARQHNMPYLPGVTTPTEVQQAIKLGLGTLKLFPAGPLGPGWISALNGPFPDIELVAVGGVSAASAPHFIEAGALGVGIGGALSSDEAVHALAGLSPRRVHPSVD